MAVLADCNDTVDYIMNRFKERGYYYAREVLNEYLKRTDKKE